jgi:glyoxylase-like metal-dependent hydrolase (beta-lactamase superfamily II)
VVAVVTIPFVPPLDDVRYGEPEQVSPLIRRVIAENPNKYSYRGTGTYIVGRQDVVVIDPGPALDAHRDALARALQGERVRAILVTHCHSDHSPLAAWLRDETGAPTIAFGPHGAVADDEPDEPDDEPEGPDPESDVKVEESIDLAFVPDVVALEGDVVFDVGGMPMRAVHTPGHTSNHLCFSLDAEQALFTGDHVMGWSTTVVSPPDGDMRAYMESLAKVRGRHDRTLWPTHGNPVTDVEPFLEAYFAHRVEREQQVLAQLRMGPATIKEMVAVLYADVREELHKAAGRSVYSHLIKLVDDGLVAIEGDGPVRRTSTYHAV